MFSDLSFQPLLYFSCCARWNCHFLCLTFTYIVGQAVFSWQVQCLLQVQTCLWVFWLWPCHWDLYGFVFHCPSCLVLTWKARIFRCYRCANMILYKSMLQSFAPCSLWPSYVLMVGLCFAFSRVALRTGMDVSWFVAWFLLSHLVFCVLRVVSRIGVEISCEYRTKWGMTKVVLRGSWGCHHCKTDINR